MQLDYSLLLDNIRRRRYDEAIRTHVLSASFNDENVPDPVKYAVESMLEVDESYAYKVYGNTRRIHHVLAKAMAERNISPAFRYHGPLRTETHIRLYGEVELFCILHESAGPKNVAEMGQVIKDIMQRQDNIQTADYADGVKVKLITQKPICRIHIIPCVWINNPEYEQSKHEMFRGVAIYNFKDKTRRKMLPFLNMARIQTKDQNTLGHFKQIVRLMKSLSTDESIPLNDYEVSGLLYNIDDTQMTAPHEQILGLLPNVSEYMEGLVGDTETFEKLVSPSQRELVFGHRMDKLEAVRKLKSSLDKLISDLQPHMGEDLDKTLQWRLE